MSQAQVFDRGRHSVTKLRAHLVFVTRYRRKVLTPDGLATIETAMQRVASEMSFSVVELNGEPDHVHVVVRYPPKLSVSKIVNALKGVSSRRYRQGGHLMPSPKSLWTPSYFAASVGGAPIAVLRQYVQDQKAGLKAGVSDPGELR
jgi:putative transposase